MVMSRGFVLANPKCKAILPKMHKTTHNKKKRLF